MSFYFLKDKMTTNHDKMYYRSFRKVFYTDIFEIANMTEAGKYGRKKKMF